ncbi:MAG TPA: hypothetical protein VG326_09070 [Tepidisphaeraceae bacterium]|jgi:hypothetical protein|nr:hypothetical protein [Tepidisphaeraceae bacterium]
MFQLNPPLVRIIVGGPGWEGPTGRGVANLVEPGHRDDDIVWIIDLDENGQTWCVPNRYVRAPRNITYGRKLETNSGPTPQATNGHAFDGAKTTPRGL